MRAGLLVGLSTLGLMCGCVGAGDVPPVPPSPGVIARMAASDVPLRAPGFDVPVRTACAPTVTTALAQGADAIRQARLRAADVECLDDDTRLTPLTLAVIRHADAGRVEALLETGVDVNARWSSRGDRFALQDAIELRKYGRPVGEQSALVALLLRRGADPNQRWCPFESRGQLVDGTPGCVSARGTTPLITSTQQDQPGLVYRLLDAGADPWLEDWDGATALEYARSEAVFALLEAAMFPDPTTRQHEVLAHTRAQPVLLRPTPSDTTVLSRERLWGSYSPRQGEPGFWASRVSILLRRGADPNERITRGADLTQLAIAIARDESRVVEWLLAAGADPNGRWCSGEATQWRPATFPRLEGCHPERGLTPLMSAAAKGRTQTIALLLAHGADPSLTDWKGRTARDHAREAKRLAQYDEAAKGGAPGVTAGRP